MAAGLKLLVATSDPIKRSWIMTKLAEAAMEAVTATDTTQLLGIVKEEAIDVILLDPDLGDAENQVSIRKVCQQLPDIPVVILLPPKAHERALENIEQGAQGFIFEGDLEASSVAAVVNQAFERQKATNTIRENERQLNNLLGKLPGYVYRCKKDSNWTMEYLSPGFQKLTGYKPEEVIHNKKIAYNELIHPQDREKVQESAGSASEHDSHFQLEYRICCRDGSVIWVWEQGSAVRRGTPQEIQEGYVADISERKAREVQMQSLIAIGNILRDKIDSPEALRAILNAISEHYQTPSAAYLTAQPPLGALRVEAASGGLRLWEGREIGLKGSLGVATGEQTETLKKKLHAEKFPQSTFWQEFPNEYILLIPMGLYGKSECWLVIGRDFEFQSSELDAFKAIAEIFASGVERTNLRKHTQRQVERLESLHAIDQAISAVYDIHVVHKLILDQVCKELGADAADILEFNPVTNTLDCVETKGFLDTQTKGTRYPLTTSLAGQIFLEHESKFIQDMTASPLKTPHSKAALQSFHSYYGAPITIKGNTIGVLETFFSQPFQPDEEWLQYFQALVTQTSMAYDSYRKFADLQKMEQKMAASLQSAIVTWSKTLELQEIESHGHIRRVTDMTMRLARAMGVDEEEMPKIERGALLHDIGKLGVMDEILQKKGALSEADWKAIKRHPVIARDLLRDVKILEDGLDIPYCHHENWDGSGYPQGLKGEAIPLSARIFAVVETYDALISERPYRKAWPEEKARQYLREQKEIKFDPELVDLFLESLQQD